MQHSDRIAGDRDVSQAIHGVVADVVRAPELLEVAVEATLGDRLGGRLGGRAAAEVGEEGGEPGGGQPSEATFEGEGGAASWISPAWEGQGIEVEDRTQLVAAGA